MPIKTYTIACLTSLLLFMSVSLIAQSGDTTISDVLIDSSAIALPDSVALPDTLSRFTVSEDVIMHPIQPKTLPNVLFYLLLLVSVMLTYTKHHFTSYMQKLYTSFWSLNMTRQFYEDLKHTNFLVINVLLDTSIILTFGLLAFLGIKYAAPQADMLSDSWLLAGALSAMLAYFLFKQFVLQGMALLLPVGEVINFYIFNRKLILSILTIILLPLIALLAFTGAAAKQFAVGAIAAILIANAVYLAYRGIIIAKDCVRFHKFHFFLYLCTLEIVPLLIVGKLVHMFFS